MNRKRNLDDQFTTVIPVSIKSSWKNMFSGYVYFFVNSLNLKNHLEIISRPLFYEYVIDMLFMLMIVILMPPWRDICFKSPSINTINNCDYAYDLYKPGVRFTVLQENWTNKSMTQLLQDNQAYIFSNNNLIKQFFLW